MFESNIIDFNEFNETINACSDGSGITEIYPLGGYGSAQSFGRWFGGAGGAALRGGVWSNGTDAGAFAVYLTFGPSNMFPSFGFRCVYRP